MNRAPAPCDTIDIAGDGRESGDAVGSVGLHRVDVGGGGDLDGLFPRAAHEPALPAPTAVGHRCLGGSAMIDAHASTGGSGCVSFAVRYRFSSVPRTYG